MEKVNYVTEDLRREILDFLYFDEIYNAILIEQIQNKANKYDGLYINKGDGKVTDILHIRNDGNSDLTNFSYSSEQGLENIAYQIKASNFNKILLAGKLEAVSSLLEVLNKEKSITPNTFYKLDQDKYRTINIKLRSEIRRAATSDCDIETVKKFTVKFFEAETAEDIAEVTNNKKILDKIKTGVYILELDKNAIGMARFIGKTSNYVEITSVYIDEKYRRNGFGKELIFHMIEIAINEGRTPILATSISNIAAIKTYENIGFVKYGDCAFEFLD